MHSRLECWKFRHLRLRMRRAIHAFDNNWAHRQPIDLYTKWEILMVYTRKVSRAQIHVGADNRGIYSSRSLSNHDTYTRSRTIIVTISFRIILPAPPRLRWLANDFVPAENYPSRITDRTPPLHSVNFPSGRVPCVSKSHLIEISNVRLIHPWPPLPQNIPFCNNHLCRVQMRSQKNKISLCSRYEPEACDGRIQKSKHSRPNCR